MGSECVKAHCEAAHPETALRILADDWRQKRHYNYKLVRGVTYIIGKNEQSGRWWVAASQKGINDWKARVFARDQFTTFDNAQEWLARHPYFAPTLR